MTPHRLAIITLFATALLQPLEAARAAEFHVAINGNDTRSGSQTEPFRTIQHAADLAEPGDTITVHAGTYRERITPPRGGQSDAKRITYQAAQGDKVTITGSEIVKNWERVANDTWKTTIPNTYFGGYNPYSERIHGDWFDPQGRQHHTGAVYLNDNWLIEAGNMDAVLKPAGGRPLWFGKADGADTGDYLLNIAGFSVGGQRIPASRFAAKDGELHAAPNSEGGDCVGWVRAGSWLKFDKVNFNAGTNSIDFRASSVSGGGDIEIRADNAEGDLLGRCEVADTGDWQKWATFTAKIKPISGERSICLIFRPHTTGGDNTTIWAQFPGVNPNESNVEINVRKTVFTPDKTNINFITVRGFILRNAATNWAPPTAGQIGLVTAYWCKGWIIENNEVCYSRCSGIALGKYSDEWDGRRGTTEGYYLTVDDAFKKAGWSKQNIGSHLVRNNRIHHCEQTGIVGSLGCAFSTVTGNEIHDIHNQNIWSGAEMAGIKFHGAIDVTISGNNIYRCGQVGGIWLDWMAQGAQIIGNLMHDNAQDIFLEMQHGPILEANNLLLSRPMTCSMNSQGIAFAHNLIAGPLSTYRGDTRITPYMVPHSTETAGMYPAAKGDSGDDRFYNNIFLAPCNLGALNNTPLPCHAAGNVFTKGSAPAKFDTNPVVDAQFDPRMTLTEKTDGWYLGITLDKSWSSKAARNLVTTGVLGSASVSNEPFENADGSSLVIDTDYFGNKRDSNNPFPGPFELTSSGPQIIKVWSRR